MSTLSTALFCFLRDPELFKRKNLSISSQTYENRRPSGYCHGCAPEDIRCFVRRQYRRFIRMSMLFPVYGVADAHFAPQTWYCGMGQNMEKFEFIRYGHQGKKLKQMVNKLSSTFRKKFVPDEYINEMRKEMYKGKTKHTTAGTNLRAFVERKIEKDVDLKRAIARLYYHDYQTFGFDISKLGVHL
ncbi:unnamed protein product [Caenorhabditis auriculariae]|uniref:Uncharacterized protein n=1 Tax=Caenorhabditis auriculariae TaxID=2777116 RepID=A0A8S1HDX1_9PELO|nr:unnamed protein product [Caenorhabditis auriculariae]